MEFSYYMVLSDRARNYEAIATGFAFLGFFYKFLRILEVLNIKRNSELVGPVHYTGQDRSNRHREWPDRFPGWRSPNRAEAAWRGLTAAAFPPARGGAAAREGRGVFRKGRQHLGARQRRGSPSPSGGRRAGGSQWWRDAFPVVAALKLEGQEVGKLE